MTYDELITRLRADLGERLLDLSEHAAGRVSLEVGAEHVRDVSRLLFDTLGARFQICSGLDTPAAIELLYHWALDRLACVVTVRVRLDRDTPEIDSIADICTAAEWIERELWELLGVQINNHPDLRHLLLSDDWPSGKYPLRRDYER